MILHSQFRNISSLCTFLNLTANLSNKVYWIVNRTADVDAMDVFLGSPVPLVNDQPCSSGAPYSPYFNYPNSLDYVKCHEGPYNPNDLTTRFQVYPSGLSFPESQCLAASFPVNSDENLKSGPSGIFCSSADFGSLFFHNKTQENGGACATFDNQPEIVCSAYSKCRR